jgi:endoglycosylceramidase
MGEVRTHFLKTLTFLVVFLVNSSLSFASGQIHTDGRYFKDQQGRAVLLRGVDLSNGEKLPPFTPLSDLSQLQKLKDWGINNIRLGFIWEAFEPNRGEYNFAYLDQLAEVVNAAGKLGISTIIDFHTDAFSRYSAGGCGSGFPKWTIPPGLFTYRPNNGILCTMWGTFAGVDDLVPVSDFRLSIDAFYSDTYGVRTAFLKAWTEIARYFKNNDNIVGYDILNEPWGSEKDQIMPLYEDAARVIRSEDADAILFVEPYVLSALGMVESKLPKPSFKNFAYAPHDYDGVALTLRVWITWGLFVDNVFNSITSVAQRLEAPVYIGEFGTSGAGVGMKNLIEHYYRLFDKNFVSAGRWDFSTWTAQKKDGWNFEDMSIVDADGHPRRNFFVRPYPATVAGEPGPINENFPNALETKYLKFSWNNRPELGMTVFSIPKDTRDGLPFKVDFTSDDPQLSCSYDSTLYALSCSSPSSGTKSIEVFIR